MAEVKTYEKILNLRERDRLEKQKLYQHSVQLFEKQATELYQLLKNKEDAESKYNGLLTNGNPINEFTSYHEYIERLRTEIRNLEQSVNKARQEMEKSRDQLTDAHIEVKKFEQLIEQKHHYERQKENDAEKMLMDELMITQFLKSKAR